MARDEKIFVTEGTGFIGSRLVEAIVDDVVRRLLLAMEKGRFGQKYFLAGENASLNQFFRIVDRITARRHLQSPLLRAVPMLFAHVQQLLADWCGANPKITPGWVRTFFADWPCSCQKTERELGCRVTPLEEGIRITYQCLQP